MSSRSDIPEKVLEVFRDVIDEGTTVPVEDEEYENALAAALQQYDDEHMEPGRWWQVLAPDGSLWCQTSSEQEARSAKRKGDKLQRLYVAELSEWRDVS